MIDPSPRNQPCNPYVKLRRIRSEDLTVADLPTFDSDWRAVLQFALTFNAYDFWGSFEGCAEIAQNPDLTSLNEIRTSLFFEQRAWRHYGDESPSGNKIEHWLGLVAAIRALLVVRNGSQDA